MKRLQVIDFFCGAGGFSEGFRQQGFEIVMGIDNWQLAIETHNLNHNLHDETKDVLKLGSSFDEIVLFQTTKASARKQRQLEFRRWFQTLNHKNRDAMLSFLRTAFNNKIPAWVRRHPPSPGYGGQGAMTGRHPTPINSVFREHATKSVSRAGSVVKLTHGGLRG